jgi:hypothetical protein
MRRVFLLMLMLLSLLLVIVGVFLVLQQPLDPPAAALPSPSADGVRRTTVDELQAQLAASNPPLVWEFRSPESYANAHIPGSRLVTMEGIPDAAAATDKRQAIVTLCA